MKNLGNQKHPKTNTSDWQKAVDAFESGDYRGALFIFMKIAKSRPNALVEIGNIYELGGGGVTQDFSEAKSWYERAVFEVDDSKAKLALGRLYFYGHGVTLDYCKAERYFQELPEEPGALYALGLLYQYGLAGKSDFSKAKRYFEVAIRKGHLLAQRQYGILLFRTGKPFRGAAIVLASVVQIFRAVFSNPEDPRVRIV